MSNTAIIKQDLIQSFAATRKWFEQSQRSLPILLSTETEPEYNADEVDKTIAAAMTLKRQAKEDDNVIFEPLETNPSQGNEMADSAGMQK